jgi:succinate dehydrogenase/fumarate reductase-like Fe-S protein
MTEQATATLAITRGDGERSYVQNFEIPYEPGASILDGLMWIREHVDATLAFRYSCISANVCKECVIRVDGRNAYACTERLKDGTTTLEPLTTKPILRDLACQSVPPKERAHP